MKTEDVSTRPERRASISISILAASFALGLVGAEAAAKTGRDTPVEVAGGSARSWSKAHRGSKAEKALAAVLRDVEAAVPAFLTDVRSARLRAFAAELALPERPAEKRRRAKPRTVGKRRAAEAPVFPLPEQVQYRFGARTLIALDAKNRALTGALKKGRAPAAEDLGATTRIEALLLGAIPETELALAEIERRLDVHDGADAYAGFLESWRNHGPNGEESFYEALDRTAGTEEEVFFYDAMLGDFVGRFAPRSGKAWPLQEQHDRNQRSFLAYRQYRGFVEAVAFALLTPPDVALPARLARYDYSSVAPGLYSLRHQVDLMVAFADGDVAAVVDDLAGFLRARPLPADLWDGYDPLGAMGGHFREKVTRALRVGGPSADEMFEEQRAARLALAERVRAAATAALRAH